MAINEGRFILRQPHTYTLSSKYVIVKRKVRHRQTEIITTNMEDAEISNAAVLNISTATG